jgi:hypothetical protein
VVESAKRLLYSPVSSGNVCQKEGIFFGIFVALLDDLASNFQDVLAMNHCAFIPDISGKNPRILDTEEMNVYYHPDVQKYLIPVWFPVHLMIFLVDCKLKCIFKVDAAQLEMSFEELQLKEYFQKKTNFTYINLNLKSNCIDNFEDGDCSVLALYAATQFLLNKPIQTLTKIDIKKFRCKMGKRILKLNDNIF